jgi:hypothetical protein
MRQKSVHPESSSEQIVKTIRRATRKRHSSEEKIQIVLDGLRGDDADRIVSYCAFVNCRRIKITPSVGILNHIHEPGGIPLYVHRTSVSRFRRLYQFAARSHTNVGTKGTLATI